MKEQANSPLELYEKAYRLQYDENRIPEACRLYKLIIDEFPDSNECGYAVIQLEKIIAGTMSERINVTSRWNTILAVIAIVVSMAALVGVLLAGSIYTNSANARISSLSLVSQALAKLQVGKDKEALEILDNAKSIAKNKDMTPYLLSADIFLMRQQYSKAMSEFDTLKKLSGAESLAVQEMARAKAEESSAKKAAVVEKQPAETELPKTEPEPAKEKPEPPVREIKAKSKKEAPASSRLQKQRKAPTTAHQDSVSFF
jgi:tetratricopeptide (TPR) repeat protein